jgi:hypothetical protein
MRILERLESNNFNVFAKRLAPQHGRRPSSGGARSGEGVTRKIASTSFLALPAPKRAAGRRLRFLPGG